MVGPLGGGREGGREWVGVGWRGGSVWLRGNIVRGEGGWGERKGRDEGEGSDD